MRAMPVNPVSLRGQVPLDDGVERHPHLREETARTRAFVIGHRRRSWDAGRGDVADQPRSMWKSTASALATRPSRPVDAHLVGDAADHTEVLQYLVPGQVGEGRAEPNRARLRPTNQPVISFQRFRMRN